MEIKKSVASQITSRPGGMNVEKDAVCIFATTPEGALDLQEFSFTSAGGVIKYSVLWCKGGIRVKTSDILRNVAELGLRGRDTRKMFESFEAGLKDHDGLVCTGVKEVTARDGSTYDVNVFKWYKKPSETTLDDF